MGCGASSEEKPKQAAPAPGAAPAAEVEETFPEGQNPYFDLIMDVDLGANKWPAALTGHKAASGHQSLMAKTMTEELFEEYKDVVTPNGWTIARAINSGTCHPSSFVGCHAGDKESYKIFEKLFNPVIEGYHVGYALDGSQSHVTDMDVDKIEEALGAGTQSKIISTRIRCARNLNFFPLNPGGTKETRLQIADLMEKVFATFEGDLAGKFHRHTDMTAEETKDLVDKHFLFRGKDKMQAASGYHADWPHGRGIFVSHDEQFLVWCNEGDHLRIISMEKGGDVKSVFGRLGRAVAAMEAGVKAVAADLIKEAAEKRGEEVAEDEVPSPFMSDPILGMITCCPSNLGTCMRGSVHILVPKLIASIGFEKIDEIARGMNCQARGSSGEHSEVIDRIDISNWRRLGFTEYSLVQDMIKCANALAQMEDEAPEIASGGGAAADGSPVLAVEAAGETPLVLPAGGLVMGAVSRVSAAAVAAGSMTSDPIEVCKVILPESPSDDLKAFTAAFADLSVKSDAGKAKRAEQWPVADPNGNGFCSLAEIDGWVLKFLIATLGSTDEGTRLWRAFRPSYIRAFNDAKDIGKEIRIGGTASATTEDYVTKGEFRCLCAYLCLYAAMFDAFAAIDGSTGEFDDRRMSLEEWEGAFETLKVYPFTAVAKIVDETTEDTAASVFSEMDADGKGMVLLAEFCTYIEQAEKSAGTPIGILLTLAEDELEGSE